MSHHSHHSHCHDESCCSSGARNCSGHHHHHGHDSHNHYDCCHEHPKRYSDQLLELADEAWLEVLKDKIKEEIVKHSGEHLTKTAKLVASANHTRWKDKMGASEDRTCFEDELHALLFSKHERKSRGK